MSNYQAICRPIICDSDYWWRFSIPATLARWVRLSSTLLLWTHVPKGTNLVIRVFDYHACIQTISVMKFYKRGDKIKQQVPKSKPKVFLKYTILKYKTHTYINYPENSNHALLSISTNKNKNVQVLMLWLFNLVYPEGPDTILHLFKCWVRLPKLQAALKNNGPKELQRVREHVYTPLSAWWDHLSEQF